MTNLEKLDTLPALQKALEQERERAARLLEGQCFLTARAEQAETERYTAHCEASEAQLEVESLRARAELAETALAAEQEMRLRTLHRAEQAERERDEAREMHSQLSRVCVEHQTARERAEAELAELKRRFEVSIDDRTRLHADLQRAEADNAALREALHSVVIRAAHPEDTTPRPMLTMIENASFVMLKHHPGAVLLERVRTLEAVRTEVDVVAGIERGTEEAKRAAWERMWSACAAADALKGKP